MKKFLFLLLIVPLLGFTWQGELNPNDFDKWPIISVHPIPQGLIWMFVKNPDQTSSIDIVAMAVDSKMTLLGYRYFKNGDPYVYLFNTNEQRYVRKNLSDDQRRSCMSCHSGKVIPKMKI